MFGSGEQVRKSIHLVSYYYCYCSCWGKFQGASKFYMGELMFCCAGATLACGTGACATVVAAVLEGRAGRVSLLLL